MLRGDRDKENISEMILRKDFKNQEPILVWWTLYSTIKILISLALCSWPQSLHNIRLTHCYYTLLFVLIGEKITSRPCWWTQQHFSDRLQIWTDNMQKKKILKTKLPPFQEDWPQRVFILFGLQYQNFLTVSTLLFTYWDISTETFVLCGLGKWLETGSAVVSYYMNLISRVFSSLKSEVSVQQRILFLCFKSEHYIW